MNHLKLQGPVYTTMKKMHRSRILGEWSNMIGHDMGSSPTRVYTTGQDFSSGELQAWMKNDIATTMETLFARSL
jgi:hypothetical protein